jgi:hypothetical protein
MKAEAWLGPGGLARGERQFFLGVAAVCWSSGHGGIADFGFRIADWAEGESREGAGTRRGRGERGQEARERWRDGGTEGQGDLGDKETRSIEY